MAIAIWDAKVVKERELVSSKKNFTYLHFILHGLRDYPLLHRVNVLGNVNLVRKIIFPNVCLWCKVNKDTSIPKIDFKTGCFKLCNPFWDFLLEFASFPWNNLNCLHPCINWECKFQDSNWIIWTLVPRLVKYYLNAEIGLECYQAMKSASGIAGVLANSFLGGKLFK